MQVIENNVVYDRKKEVINGIFHWSKEMGEHKDVNIAKFLRDCSVTRATLNVERSQICQLSFYDITYLIFLYIHLSIHLSIYPFIY